MNSAINCLMLRDGELTVEVCEALLQSARTLYRGGTRMLVLKREKDGFGGDVSTEFRLVSIGTLSGLLFEADIWNEQGKVSVDFFVKRAHLEEIDPGKMRGMWAHGVLPETVKDAIKRKRRTMH